MSPEYQEIIKLGMVLITVLAIVKMMTQNKKQ